MKSGGPARQVAVEDPGGAGLKGMTVYRQVLRRQRKGD
jgi:hypothetical protein